MRSSTRSTSRPTRTRTRISTSRPTTPIPGIWRSARCRTSTRSICTASIPYWNSIVEHPDYDAFWKDEAWVTQVKGAFVPNLNVAGFWDQEDPWGPWEIYRRSEASDPNRYNFIVAGPWFHGQWHNLKAESIGQMSFGGHDTARRSSARRSRRRGSATGCTARARSFRGRRRRSRPDRTAGRPTPRGRRRRRRPTCICAPTARCRSTRRRPATATCSTSPTRRTRCRTARVRSRRPIRPATGAAGRWRISASSTIVPTWRPGSARRSIAT